MKELIPSFSYTVLIELLPVWGVKTVRNISNELKYEAYTEGGLNDRPYIIPQPISDIKTIEITARVPSTVIPGKGGNIYSAGKRFKLPIYIGVSVPGDLIKGISFAFTGCMVVNQTFSELNSESSSLLESTITLAYEKLYILNGVSIVI